jgi:outer membrane protein OmpA-like peptidoglycan-associated protein
VEGHTDAPGTSGANQRRSLARAEAVKRWLTTHAGVPAERIATVGHGEDVPIAPNSTRAGRAANRRIMIQLAEH